LVFRDRVKFGKILGLIKMGKKISLICGTYFLSVAMTTITQVSGIKQQC